MSPALQVEKGWFNLRFNLQDNTKLPLMFGVGCLAVLALSFSLSATARLSFTIPLLTAVGGITGFLYAQHTRDIQLFRELFREFNKRYGKLNDDLNKIRNRPPDQPLEDTDHGVLFAYFNLCAEEYMYFTAGHIDPRVWCAWVQGMRYFDQDPEIHKFWRGELRQGSYYGFTLDCTPNRTETAPR